MPIEKCQLLGAMCGIVGGIQIDGDPTSATLQSFTMSFDHRVGQCFGHTKQLFTTHTIFKTREGWLGSQIALSAPQVQVQMVPKGSGLQHIHLEDLRQDCVPVPPLVEQDRITLEVARRISVLDEIERELDSELRRATTLRHSILKRAFEGNLTCQDPQDEPASSLLERIRTERKVAPKSSALGRRRKGEALHAS